MKNLAALTAVLALAAGLAACTSSGSSTATATAKATTTPVSGTETLSGKLTGPAAASTDILVFHLRLTGPVGTTATIRLGTGVPEKYELYTFHTAVGDLAVTLASAGTSTGGLKSATTCLYVLTTAVPFTVDGANSPASSRAPPAPARQLSCPPATTRSSATARATRAGPPRRPRRRQSPPSRRLSS